LVVDDDQEVSDLLVIVLQRAGYFVMHAGSGEEALELSRKWVPGFEFAVVDLSLPGASGATTILSLRKIWPTLKVVACSGDLDEGNALLKCGLSDLRFLKKPFTADTLLATFRELSARR
jgi:DNA-binding response OmpR family regulator